MREPGQTFKPDQIGWFDWETKSDVDIDVGTFRYMASASPLILAVAVGEGAVRVLPYPLTWQALPAEIRDHHQRVARGEAVWAAWNASFDREVWNQLTDFPELEPEHVIDVMAQATAAGLPGKLDGAARAARVPVKKRKSGKELIKLFCSPGSTATALTHPQEWAEFLLYAGDDVEAMRGVFRFTLQLPIEEWQEYWVNERVNLTGIAFDQVLAERAKVMAAADKANSAIELQRLTAGKVGKVTEVKKMIGWLRTALQPADQSYLVRQLEERDEDTDEITKKEKLSLDRRRIQLLTALLDAKATKTPEEIAARRLLDIRQYGGSTTPAKFGRMLDSHVGGLLLGQFVFNGAPQTGRFSSRGIQLHNLMRDALPYEMDAIDSLLNGATLPSFATLGDNTAICRKLSMLIRPTLIPEDTNNAFVWGDWSQIEARVTPWLADVQSRLDIFREVDVDPSKPDLYTRTAATVSEVSVDKVTKAMRQRGKVMELSLTFCGGKGALQGMAASYGMHLDDETAQLLVNQWREANPWALDYSRQLWEAVREAHEAPGHFSHVGPISFVFLKDYLGGTLLCRLPSGRFLTYRALRWETVNEYDDNDVIIDSKWELTFARGYGRIKLWPGFFVENLTQAVAADVLRGTLVRADTMLRVRAHTHDEILTEVPVDRAEAVADALTVLMESGFDWSQGLPLKAESTIALSYTKCPEAQGL
jgi:DNA polymerase